MIGGISATSPFLLLRAWNWPSRLMLATALFGLKGLVVLSQGDQDCTAEEQQDCQSYPKLKVRDAALGIQSKSCRTRKCSTDHQQCSEFAAQHGFGLYFSINDCSRAAMKAWYPSLHGTHTWITSAKSYFRR